jgi:hypothetical protein
MDDIAEEFDEEKGFLFQLFPLSFLLFTILVGAVLLSVFKAALFSSVLAC